MMTQVVHSRSMSKTSVTVFLLDWRASAVSTTPCFFQNAYTRGTSRSAQLRPSTMVLKNTDSFLPHVFLLILRLHLCVKSEKEWDGKID